MSTTCHDCDQVKINDVALPSSLSPMTTLCSKKNALNLYNLILDLIEFKYTSPFDVTHWKSFVMVNFTHLHLIFHNIFSPNTINTEPVNGMFLSSHSLHQLLEDENTARVTQELFIFLSMHWISIVNMIHRSNNGVMNLTYRLVTKWRKIKSGDCSI